MAQLEHKYGDQFARSILGGCASKAIFNPQEYKSAAVFSNFLGEEEFRYTQTSRGSSNGKGSVNRTEQHKTRKLFEPSRFLRLNTGHCILINPGYSNGLEAAVPIQQEIRLPRAELNAVERSTDLWKEYQRHLIGKRRNRPEPSKEDLIHRYKMVEDFFKEKEQTTVGERKLPFKLDKLPNLLKGITSTGATA
jgi:type IV secretory pathway TraG/TraD family ATPase VirD4